MVIRIGYTPDGMPVTISLLKFTLPAGYMIQVKKSPGKSGD
jgi:hypothetical protein